MGLSYRQGKSYTRQSVANMQHRQYCDNHPASYDWKAIGVNSENGLVIWRKDSSLLQRHPAGDCWLLFHCGCWQPIDKHISQLSQELETLKMTIEQEIDKEEFNAAVELLAA